MKKDQSLYFIAIVPPEPFLSQVQSFKKEAQELFHSKAAQKSPPHITLRMPFGLKEKKERALITSMTELAGVTKPLLITVKGVGAFPPRVVYLHVEFSASLFDLHKSTARLVRLLTFQDNATYKDRGYHPHMTIAFRDLKKNKFQEAYDHFSEKVIDWHWECADLCLLKHDTQRWQILQTFSFDHRPY